MDLLFIAIVFGLVFGSQAYSALKLFIFPEYYKGFYGLKFGLWLMCVAFDSFIFDKLWWMIFIIGIMHIVLFLRIVKNEHYCNYLSTPLHPRNEKQK